MAEKARTSSICPDRPPLYQEGSCRSGEPRPQAADDDTWVAIADQDANWTRVIKIGEDD
jgi:hypothetical protein